MNNNKSCVEFDTDDKSINIDKNESFRKNFIYNIIMSAYENGTSLEKINEIINNVLSDISKMEESKQKKLLIKNK